MKKIFDVFREIAKNQYHLIVFTAFFLFEAYGLSSVVITGDDHYYANFVKNGFDYFLSENVLHYMETNGRAVIHLLDELILALPLTVWKLIELFIVSAIVWLIAAIAAGDTRDEKRFPPALVMSCTLFSMIHLHILRETVLWPTGSFNYVLPILLVLLLYYVFTKLVSGEKGAWYLPVLAFFASVTTEQSATAAVIVCFFVVIKTAFVEKKKLKLSYIISLPASLCGFAVLFLAPGNSARMDYYTEFYATPLFERLANNFMTYFRAATSTTGMLFFFAALFVVAAFSSLAKISKMDSESIKEKNGVMRLLFQVVLFICSFITAVTLILYSPIFSWIFIRMWLCAGLVLFTSILLILQFAVSLFSGKDSGTSLLFACCAVVTFGAMVFSPVYGSRVYFAPIILMCVPIIQLAYSAFEVKFARVFIPLCVTSYAAYIISSRYFALIVFAYFVLLLELVSPKLKRFHPSAILAICVSMFMLFTIGRGFGMNTVIHWYNSAAIKAYVEAGDISEPLVLSYPVESEYLYCPPYVNSYHLMRFKQYYGIPNDAEIVYKEATELGIN